MGRMGTWGVGFSMQYNGTPPVAILIWNYGEECPIDSWGHISAVSQVNELMDSGVTFIQSLNKKYQASGLFMRTLSKSYHAVSSPLDQTLVQLVAAQIDRKTTGAWRPNWKVRAPSTRFGK